jgi:hypothetical protein
LLREEKHASEVLLREVKHASKKRGINLEQNKKIEKFKSV